MAKSVRRAPAQIQHWFDAIAVKLMPETGVTLGSLRRGFGSAGLQINGKIFALVSSKGYFVVKLPKPRVDKLEASGKGQRFDPGHGRLMKEWLMLKPTSEKAWLSLAWEALRFVRDGR